MFAFNFFLYLITAFLLLLFKMIFKTTWKLWCINTLSNQCTKSKNTIGFSKEKKNILILKKVSAQRNDILKETHVLYSFIVVFTSRLKNKMEFSSKKDHFTDYIFYFFNYKIFLSVWTCLISFLNFRFIFKLQMWFLKSSWSTTFKEKKIMINLK